MDKIACHICGAIVNSFFDLDNGVCKYCKEDLDKQVQQEEYRARLEEDAE